MKILLIITGLNVGGAERQVCDLADEYAGMGHRVTILSLISSVVLRPKNREIDVFHLSLSKTPWSFVRELFAARKIVKKFAPDIVHSHMFHANIFARFLRLLCPLKCLICTAHNVDEGGSLRMFVYRVTNGLADLFTNVSCSAVEAFVRKKAVRQGQMICVYNGINFDRYHFSEPERARLRKELNLGESYCLLAVGRISPQKDYGCLLQAVGLCLPRIPQIRLLIAGRDDGLLPQLQKQCHDLSIADRVVFLGSRADVPSLLSAADLFVLSSSFEGYSLVVAEAAASGVPIVSTDVGAVREIMSKFTSIVPVANPKALAKQIYVMHQKLAQNKDRSVRTQAQVEFESQFSIAAVAERWIQIYGDTLKVAVK